MATGSACLLAVSGLEPTKLRDYLPHCVTAASAHVKPPPQHCVAKWLATTTTKQGLSKHVPDKVNWAFSRGLGDSRQNWCNVIPEGVGGSIRWEGGRGVRRGGE